MDALDYAEKSMKQDLPGSFSPIWNENRLIKDCAYAFSQEKFSDVLEIIAEDDFTDERNALAFKVAKQLFNENEPIDYYTMGTRLNEISRFNQLGGNGINYLVTLSDDGGSHDWIVNAKEIRRYSDLRRLSRKARKWQEIIENPQGESVEAILNIIYSDVNEEAERNSANTQGPKSLTRAYIERGLDIRDRQQNPEKFQEDVIPTGYPAIDQLLAGGFRKGNLIVVGARPGTGKTTLGLNIAERLIFNSAIQDPVLFFSLEMPFNEITDRFMASVAGIEHSQILNAKLSYEDYIQWQNGRERLQKSNEIFVDDTSNLKPIEIRARAGRFKQRFGLSLIVIDYLQYIQIPGYKNKVEELTKISNELKALAKDLNVPVVALAQLNRNSENRGDKTPGIADLRGSGSIEQDADIAMFIYRKDPDEQQTEILISKNRHGQTGSVFLTFNGQYSRFEDQGGDYGS